MLSITKYKQEIAGSEEIPLGTDKRIAVRDANAGHFDGRQLFSP